MITEMIAVGTLTRDPRNVRKHDARNVAAIKASLQRFGQQKRIVVGSDDVVIAGNGTLMAAIELGWTEIGCVRSELAGAEARAYGIADNRTTDLSEFNNAALAEQLREMAANLPLLEACGFHGDDLLKLLPDMPELGQTDADDIPAPPDKAITQPGDLWILGDHRLLCGDSSKSDQLDRLLADAQIHLVNTDPPYNVKVEPRSNNAIAAGLSSFAGPKHHQSLDLARNPSKSKPTGKKLRAKDRPLANDFVTDDEFDELLDAWFGNIARVLIPGRSFYIWGGYANLGNYPPYLKRHELYFSQGIIWDKLHPVLTRKDFMGAFEIAFYGWKLGAGHEFFGPNNATDLWHVKKVTPQSMVHLTEKPVELAVMAMQYSSRSGENVLDLFGGSGSTLIGAEQTGRHAFLMELDALYCDVIVARWEKFTGRTAERVSP